MKEESFKAFTLQLILLIEEASANATIFHYWNNRNNPERLKHEAKIEELKHKLKQALIAENYTRDSIVVALVKEQAAKFTYEVDNIGI
jgi:hypothetical protein